MSEQPVFYFKVSIVGDSAVGKTSLIDQFVNQKFEENYIATMGVNITLKDAVVDDTPTQLMIWDIGGSESWAKVRSMFYRGSNGVIFVYDVTRPATFLNITHYLQDFEESIQKKIPFILIGNKIDLTHLRKIVPENANELMKASNAVAFFETSAKTGENVEMAFHLIAQACLKQSRYSEK
ncbi:MAG TPA: Rab family GTPase [Candidatus Deferrimicrobium sp.]|nr:Rab family GTPase [Candidatus Deferrimicrobium sp.]